MPPRITWLGKAADRISRDLLPILRRDLIAAFPRALGVAVYDCFSGYRPDQAQKIVLGVEVRERHAYHTHVVKVGASKVVSDDYNGWESCILRHNCASRIFVSLEKRELPHRRAAIVYQDAFRLFGTADDTTGPQPLETIVHWAIRDDKPDPVSVERVIRQIYSDLYRWFYRSPRASATAALKFYRRRLRRGLGRWATDPWCLDLRRDLLWLLCGHDVPDAFRDVFYLDPYDYVAWATQHGHVPQTLIGRGHGDLHGRNILVGVQRGEAEYPAVFDYGEMRDGNVLVWDFVKLESELKVRLLLPLYDDPAVREALFNMPCADGKWPGVMLSTDQPTATLSARSLRAQQMAFAFRFETVLAVLTARIHRLSDPALPEPPGGRKITGNRCLDRALGILLRIRQEAALCLGDGQPQRGPRGLWQDEYYFALAVYGLSAAKFNYKNTELAFALVSAGVAVAHMEGAAQHIRTAMRETAALVTNPRSRARHPYPSYRAPLAHAHRAWKGRRTRARLEHAMRVMQIAERHFPHAVPLHQEYVLLLAEAGRYRDALRLLSPLEDICSVFHDEETLCRVGRMCKDLGDRAVGDAPVAARQLSGHPAMQWYVASYRRYREAHAVSGAYYPGINAATLARMIGNTAESQQLAAQVIETCRGLDLSQMHVEDCFWVLATQAEAHALLGKGAEAAALYREALRLLTPQHVGMAQSAYNQVCRLCWTLGDVAQPARAVFRDSGFRLSLGPFCRVADGTCSLR